MTKKIIHCSYHKCLTVYYGKVMSRLYNYLLPFRGGYRHFNSFRDAFYEEHTKYKFVSLNNHILDFDRLGDYRISRFIRDPRDLVVSGYFYHLRGAEPWCNIISPVDKDWEIVNGCLPSGIGRDDSFSGYLQKLSKEDGLIAEIEFRRKHFESMMLWPDDNERIKTFRYETILGNEVDVFERMFEFYGLPWLDRRLGIFLAKRYTAGKQRKSKHIRNPEPNQWKKHFTPKVSDYFDARYSDLLIKLAYDQG